MAARRPAPPAVIEWQHLDKRKYFLYGPLLNLGTNAVLYPTKLVRVRLQAQVCYIAFAPVPLVPLRACAKAY